MGMVTQLSICRSGVFTETYGLLHWSKKIVMYHEENSTS